MLKPSTAQVIVLAAGKGVRMRSRLPKVLHRVCGVTLLERTLRAVHGFGCQSVVVVIGFGHELVAEELSRLSEEDRLPGLHIQTVVQHEQRGTGHAVQQAFPLLDPEGGTCVVLPGDVPLVTKETLIQAAAQFDEGDELALLSTFPESPTGYGRVVRDGAGRVLRIVEEKDCSADERGIREINTSLYFVSPRLLGEALPSFTPQNAQHELYFTDIVGYATSRGISVKAVIVDDSLSVSGANTRAELSRLERIRRDQIAEDFMDRGVTFEDPATAFIEEDVQIGEDSFIGAGTRLLGKTTIGRRALLEGDSLIVDSTVGDDTVLRLGSYIEHSTVGRECEVGPFAHIRPQSILEDRVKIGNFVETKKSRLAQGVKANHLSYIGDADVGAGANVGAGTITCNYDGYRKHRTVIGAQVFIGSNTSLVAPVVVGAGAVIGAGSVITRDVPDDALAVERSDQRTIPEWALRRRERMRGEK